MQPPPQNTEPEPDPFAQLENISADQGSTQRDDKTELEVRDLAIQRKRAELQGFQQDTEERKKYAGRFFILACAWVCVIAVLLACQGFGKHLGFVLSEPVTLAAIGS